MGDIAEYSGAKYADYQRTLTCGQSTWGAWHEIVASNPFDTSMISMVVYDNHVNSYDLATQVAVGAAGSEEVIIGAFVDGNRYRAGFCDVRYPDLPLRIPKGARVSIRAASGAQRGESIRLRLISRTNNLIPTLSKADSFGYTLATSTPTIIDPGTVANTKGAWVEFVASTSHRYRAIWLNLRNKYGYGVDGGTWDFDIGVGSAGSEVAVVPDIHFYRNGADDTIIDTNSPMIPADIPAGSRVSVRCSHTLTSNQDLYALLLLLR